MRLACLDHGFVAPAPEAASPTCPTCLEPLYDLDVQTALSGPPLPVGNTVLTGAPFLFAVVIVVAHLFTSPALILRFGLLPSEVRAGRGLPTLLTHVFLHASWLHVLGNALFLYLFGKRVGLRLGRAWPVVLIVASALGGGLAHALLTGAPTRFAIGASGVVYGMIGAGLALYPRYAFVTIDDEGAVVVRSHWPRTVVFVAIYVALDVLFGRNVAVLAHLGGLVAGFLVGLPLRAVPPTAIWTAMAERDAKAVAAMEP